MKTKYFKYIFIIFAIAIMIFAIIKIKGDEQKKENTTTETKQEETTEVTELKLGVASFDSINPILSKNKNVQDISKIIFEPLMTLTKDYKLEYCLAKEWAKQNATTYIIKLKENVRWSDGEKFTADDVKFTIDKIKNSSSIYVTQVQNIANVEITDDYTLKIILNKEIPFFEYQLTFPIMSSQFFQDKEFNASLVPVGTGMYKYTDVQSTYLTLEKNNNWWDTKTKLTITKVTVNLYSSLAELYNSFKMGSIDIIDTDNNNLQEYIGTIGYAKKEMKGREHIFLALNNTSNFLSRKEIRKAISYSIDKTNIASNIFNNQYFTSSFPLDYGNWIYQEQDSSAGYNLEQAKQILVDDGWSYKYKYWQKTINYRTQRISLNFVVKASDANRVAVAQNIKTQLENQGFRINLIKANDTQYQSYLTNKNYDMILCSMNLSVSPDLSTFFGTNNLANYSNEEVTNIMNEVKNSNDENKLKQDYKRLGEIYKSEMPYLSLYNNKYTVAYSTGLAGTLEPNWFYQFYNIKDWHK